MESNGVVQVLFEEEKTLVRLKIKEPDTEKEKYWPQITTILIANLAGLTEGLHFSWPSPFIVKITQDKENYDISEEQASYFNTITPLAMALCCPIFSKLADRIGRKKTLLLISVPHILAWIIKAFATSVYAFYVARFLTGAANACSFSVLPIYMGEISHPSIRGTWGNALPISMCLGELLINIIGSYFGVQVTSFICLPVCVLFIILFCYCPESPYFYVMKGRYEEAKKSLYYLKRKRNLDNEFAQLKFDVERQLSESSNWSDVFKINSNRRALAAGLFLRFTQQTSGMGVFLVYTQYIFQKSGGNISHETSSIVYFAISLVCYLIALFSIVKRFGRKSCYVVSLTLTTLVLYLMGTYFYLDSHNIVDLSSWKWIPIVSMIAHQVFLSFGIAVIPTLMLSELFSASIKAKAMPILMAEFGIGNIIMNTIFYYLNAKVGFYAPFYFFAICCTIAMFIAIYVIPETKGKTLEEIQQLLKRK
ncbi:facilitated trehalose transporter Tret1-like [Diorhabda sublineata]|uniref:facilitated trehalose transporter Tret1-like n=1 Tax=Diorhabda sublineata TaxID=1163346 RepID=UPI0024E0790E|nr:facilitated trehalose transporter Tret1-like [Diorhabda sublineata]XP_056643751.1 facilitated trehalose transporter Tret1-like [Diorhabda sublineata]XP_056643752.1 facilitated trehalose transporter Tret1-like [Diorhabda sublineata]XP_056643753.1 facilitated trehalose transporter Tret1-like [Diorhabda sublineata]